MKFNFKKIATVLTGAVLLTSTIGFAAAANYPTPFSNTGGAVVVGANGASSDMLAAIKVTRSVTATSTTSTTASTSGETAALFTGSSKINVNDTLSQVKSVLTSTELPTVLAKGSFSGNVDATYTQTITMGSATNANSPRLAFAKQPTSSDDPVYGISLNSNTANQIYNATLTFNKAVNFTHADSKNQELVLFGQKYKIGSATTSTDLILFKSATTLNFDSTGTTSGEVTINGKKYTIELITASTTTATIAVTSEDGTTVQKEITEGASKKVNGISIAIDTADSNNQKYTASIIAGADKITLTSGSAVTTGDDATQVDGTLVTVTGTLNATTQIVVSVAAKDTDADVILQGGAFVDPVFKTFKVDFSGGLNIPDANSSSREDIVIRNAGDDKMQVKFTNNRGDEATIQYIKNNTATMDLQADDSGRNISVMEGETVYKNEYVVVGNEDQGYLLKLSTITNNTGASNYADDVVKLTDVFNSANTFQATMTSEGSGSITIGGKVYTIAYNVNPSNSDLSYVTLNFPDSTGTNKVLYPTMQTARGAKIGFYKPLNVSLDSNAGVLLPNGNGYTTVTWSIGVNGDVTLTGGSPSGTFKSNTTIGTNSATVTAGSMVYNFTSSGSGAIDNRTVIYLKGHSGQANTAYPALYIIEEKDDNSAYNGLVVTTEAGNDATDGIGVNAVVQTWTNNTAWNSVTLASNSNKAKSADLFGTIALVDSTDSDQKWATISYPDEQLYANVYVGAEGSAVTPGTSGSSSGGLSVYEDSEINSVKDMNLVVVGGSCVNVVAAKILESDSPICGADFTAQTQVGPNQYLIETVKSPYNDAKIAVLVAGYDAADTTNAVDKLLTGVATDVGTSQVYPIVGTD